MKYEPMMKIQLYPDDYPEIIVILMAFIRKMADGTELWWVRFSNGDDAKRYLPL